MVIQKLSGHQTISMLMIATQCCLTSHKDGIIQAKEKAKRYTAGEIMDLVFMEEEVPTMSLVQFVSHLMVRMLAGQNQNKLATVFH